MLVKATTLPPTRQRRDMRESFGKLVVFSLLILMMFQLCKIIELVKCASFNMYYTLLEFCLFVCFNGGKETCTFRKICPVPPQEPPISPINVCGHRTHIQDSSFLEPNSGLKCPVNLLYMYSLKELFQRVICLNNGSLPRDRSAFPF